MPTQLEIDGKKLKRMFMSFATHYAKKSKKALDTGEPGSREKAEYLVRELQIQLEDAYRDTDTFISGLLTELAGYDEKMKEIGDVAGIFFAGND